MFLNEENLSVQHDLTYQLERAQSEGTLENFIADYLGFGTGSIEDIYTAVANSSVLEPSDIDRAVNYLKQNGLIQESINPIDKLIEKYSEYKDCGDDNLMFEEVNQVYFPNMGIKDWDDAYESFISKYESGKLEESLNESTNTTLLEYFKASRLTTVAKILDKQPDEDHLKKATQYYKSVASKLWPVNKIAAAKNWKNVLVYELGDPAVTTYFTGSNEPIFKKIKGWTYGKLDGKTYMYFASHGAFDQVNQALDNLKVSSASETEVAVADATTERGVDATQPKTITVKKKDNGTYYVEVPVLGSMLDSKRYASKEDAIKDVFAHLKKYKFNIDDFKDKIKYEFTEDETGATVERDPDTREVVSIKGVDIKKCLFIIDGNVYNYTAYKKQPEKKRQKAVIINNTGNVLLNRTSDAIITEDLDHEINLRKFMEALSEEERKNMNIVYSPEDDLFDEEEAMIDRLFHDADEEELRGMGAFDNLNDEDDDPWLEEDFDNDFSVECMTIEDLIQGLADNASEEEIDRQLALFKKIGKLLNVRNYDEIIVTVDDGQYDPSYIFSDGLRIPKIGSEVTHYPNAHMVAEKLNGQIFLYFQDEQTCKKYYQLAEKFLNDYEIDDNVFSSITEAANGIKKVSPIENGYHDLWKLDLGYAVHNDGGMFHVIDENNGNNYLFDSHDINQVNSFIQRELGLDMEIEPSTRVFKKPVQLTPKQLAKQTAIKEMANLDFDVGHTFDPDDFDYFKRVCKEDGWDVTEDDFNFYFECLDEIRSAAYDSDYDDDCDWFED